MIKLSTKLRFQRVREWAFYQVLTPVRYVFEKWMSRHELVFIYCVMGNGLGDALAISTILKALNKRSGIKGLVFSMHPQLFLNNPEVVKNISYHELSSWKRSLLKMFLRGMRGNSCICFGGEVWTLRTNPLTKMQLDDRREKGWDWIGHLTPDHDLNVSVKKDSPAIYFSGQEERLFRDRFSSLPQSYGVVKATVGGKRPQGSYLKNWDSYKMGQTINSVTELVWVQIGEEGEPDIGAEINLIGKTNLRESMYLVSRSKVLLSVEGFLTHVSAAFNVPSVVPMTGAYDPTAFVYKTTTPIVADPMPECSPCWKSACIYDDMPCRKNIDMSQVVGSIRDSISSAELKLVD